MQALTVSQAEAGQKLVNFLARRVEAGPGEVQRWIRSGQVRRNGGRVKPFDRLEAGDAIRVPPFAVLRPVGAADGSDSPFPLAVYEDEDLLVAAKPAGLPSQGGTGHADSLASRLAAHYVGADFVPAPVHRLDKDTSGLVLAGKSYSAQRVLSDLFAAKALENAGQQEIEKYYLAWVWGAWPQSGPQELRDSLKKDEALGRMKSGAQGDKAREAVSRVRCLRQIRLKVQDASLLLIRLLTGRTHQIRVQLSARGFPVVGDNKYGKATLNKDQRAPGLLLHACHLVLPPPYARSFSLQPDWKEPWLVRELPDFSDES